MITENLSTLKIHKLTQEQYDRELAAGNIDELAMYLTPDEELVSGTSGNWTYVKYKNGIAMCWLATTNVSSSFSSTWGGWYIHDGLFPKQTYPFTFVDYPKVFVTQRPQDGSQYTTGDYFLYTNGHGTNTQSPSFSAARPTKPASAISLSINMLVIGRWK